MLGAVGPVAEPIAAVVAGGAILLFDIDIRLKTGRAVQSVFLDRLKTVLQPGYLFKLLGVVEPLADFSHFNSVIQCAMSKNA